jgi:hypothetical protein
LTFADGSPGGGLSLTEVVVPRLPSSPRPILINGDYPSNGLGLRTTGSSDQTNLALYGSASVGGVWGVDNAGRIIGNFVEVTQDGTFTNAINFVGKVVPGKRLTLLATSSSGHFTIRGVPATNLVDLSGSWFGVRRQNGAASYEFLRLEPINDPNAINIYQVDGQGSGFSYSGIALLSVQRKLALGSTLSTGADSSTIRAVCGQLNFRTLQAVTCGIESPPGMGLVTNHVTFLLGKGSSF